MEDILKPLVVSVFIPLGLTAATTAADPGIHEKFLGSGYPKTYDSRSEKIIVIILLNK